MRRAAYAAFLSALSLCIAACGSDAASSQQPTKKVSEAVIRGSVDTDVHDRVVYLQFLVDASKGLGGACSGTLIAPNVVATARHCVSAIDESVYPPTVQADYDVKNMFVYLHVTPGSSALHSPDGKGARIIHDGSTSLVNHDFALLVTEAPVSKDISQIRLAAPPSVSEQVYVVGYGMTETDHTPDFHKRYWRDGLSIRELGPDPGEQLYGNEILLYESICEGDSGGPVMDHDTGALLAVTSRGGNGTRPNPSNPSATCTGAHNIFSRVDAYADMIKKTLADYGEVPWEEGAPRPADPPPPPPPGDLGSPCSAPSECKSRSCVDFGDKTLCSTTCSDTKPCPGGFDCNGGYCQPSSSTPPPDPDGGTTPDPDGGTTPSPDGGAGPSLDDTNTTSKGGCSVAADRSSHDATSLLSPLAALGLALAARRRRRAKA